tara:strand:- start:1311 stop:1619 length:309 start_codon:yes stop_codon:yes gene_type:complete
MAANEQEIKDLADKLMIQGLASSMMGAMEMAGNILGTEEKIKDKKKVTNSTVLESDKSSSDQESKQEEADTKENPAEEKKDESEDVLTDGKTVKELMDEFSE